MIRSLGRNNVIFKKPKIFGFGIEFEVDVVKDKRVNS